MLEREYILFYGDIYETELWEWEDKYNPYPHLKSVFFVDYLKYFFRDCIRSLKFTKVFIYNVKQQKRLEKIIVEIYLSIKTNENIEFENIIWEYYNKEKELIKTFTYNDLKEILNRTEISYNTVTTTSIYIS